VAVWVVAACVTSRQARTAGSWTCSPLPQSGTAQGFISPYECYSRRVAAGGGFRRSRVRPRQPRRCSCVARTACSRGRQRVAPHKQRSLPIKLLDSGVEIRCVDLPQIEGATGRFTLQQMASVAELEAGTIGERIKRALAASKKKLGGFRGRPATADDRARASAALTARANDTPRRWRRSSRGLTQTAHCRSARLRRS
jgi:hypothetical protein